MKNDVSFDAKINFNESGVLHNISTRLSQVQARLDVQVLKDSNYYCPMYTGTLKKSGIIHTVPGSGVIIWRTPYARKQYYGMPNKSHQYNPNATMRWFEAAKAKKLKEWVRIANDEYRKNS